MIDPEQEDSVNVSSDEDDYDADVTSYTLDYAWRYTYEVYHMVQHGAGDPIREVHHEPYGYRDAISTSLAKGRVLKELQFVRALHKVLIVGDPSATEKEVLAFARKVHYQYHRPAEEFRVACTRSSSLALASFDS